MEKLYKKNTIALLSVALTIILILIISTLYYFNWYAKDINTYIGVADSFGILLSSRHSTDYFFPYVLTRLISDDIFFNVDYLGIIIFAWNTIIHIAFLFILVRNLRYKEHPSYFIIPLLLAIFLNNYFLPYGYDVDKPYFVTIFLIMSILSLDTFFHSQNYADLGLSIITGILSISAYVSGVFFIPLYFFYCFIRRTKYTFNILKKRKFFFGIATTSFIILLIITIMNNSAIKYALLGAYLRIVDFHITHVTGFTILKAVVDYTHIPLILLILPSALLLVYRDRDAITQFSFFVYVNILFFFQSGSYSDGSRYPFYALLFFILFFYFSVYSLTKNIKKKYLIIILSLLLVLIVVQGTQFNYYLRGLWNAEKKTCDLINDLNINNSVIAYNGYPTIDYYCRIINHQDPNNNTYITYGMDNAPLLLNNTIMQITNGKVDYVLIDISASGNNPHQLLASLKQEQIPLVLLGQAIQTSPLDNSRQVKVFIYKINREENENTDN